MINFVLQLLLEYESLGKEHERVKVRNVCIIHGHEFDTVLCAIGATIYRQIAACPIAEKEVCTNKYQTSKMAFYLLSF